MYYSLNYQSSLAETRNGRVIKTKLQDSAVKGRRAFRARNRLIFDHDTAAPAPKAVNKELEKRFKKLEANWKAQTVYYSSPYEIYLDANYAQIIGMGWSAVPLILKSLQREPSGWFYALRAITGQNPVPDGIAGDFVRMSALWLEWGKRNRLI